MTSPSPGLGSSSTSAPDHSNSSLSSAPFSFKLDNIKRLSDDGAGYHAWSKQVELIIDSYDYEDLFLATTTIPTDPSQLKVWNKRNSRAKILLMSIVDQSLTSLIADQDTARKAWIALQERFDRRNDTTLYRTISKFFAEKMKAEDTMIQHINNFDTEIRRLIDRLNELEAASPYRHLANYLSDDNIKAQHLLMTLPDSFDNIIDNLKTKTGLTYLDVRTRLLELPSSSVETVSKSKALFNKGKDTKIVKKPNPPGHGKTAPVTGNNCTWCNARGKPFQGHTFKTCRALKEHNATKLGAQNPPPSSGKEIVPYRAATAQELFTDNGVAMIVSSVSPVLRAPPSNHSGVSANYTTYESIAM